jgi:hypothetical protein
MGVLGFSPGSVGGGYSCSLIVSSAEAEGRVKVASLDGPAAYYEFVTSCLTTDDHPHIRSR